MIRHRVPDGSGLTEGLMATCPPAAAARAGRRCVGGRRAARSGRGATGWFTTDSSMTRHGDPLAAVSMIGNMQSTLIYP